MNKKQVVIKCNKKKLFEHWMTLTKPFHKLRPKEQLVLASFLYYYYEYKEQVTDDKLLWKIVFDYDTKMLIKKDLGDMKDCVLQNLLTNLRNANAIIKKDYEMINPAYIPRMSADGKRFDLIFSLLIDESA